MGHRQTEILFRTGAKKAILCGAWPASPACDMGDYRGRGIYDDPRVRVFTVLWGVLSIIRTDRLPHSGGGEIFSLILEDKSSILALILCTLSMFAQISPSDSDPRNCGEHGEHTIAPITS